MKRILIAMTAHAINAAYCRAMGDDSQVDWDDAPEHQKKSALAGVDMHLANPDATPENSHESWLAQKVAEGWTYGEEKDAEAKTHPCILPYDELPEFQKAKDHIFRATVHATARAIDESFAAGMADTPVVIANPSALTAGIANGFNGKFIQYIGRRELWKDTVYDTGLSFATNEVRAIPMAIARKLLRHDDLFAEVEAPQDDQTQATAYDEDEVSTAVNAAREAKDESNLEFEIIDQINQMNEKDTLVDFVMGKYQVKMNKSKSVANLQAEAIQLVNRYGVL